MNLTDRYVRSDKYQPRMGDEVEVLLRGTVSDVCHRLDDVAYFHIGAHPFQNSIYPYAEHVVSVNRVRPPLPTEPDTVIAVGNVLSGTRYILSGSTGLWNVIVASIRGCVSATHFNDLDWYVVATPVAVTT